MSITVNGTTGLNFPDGTSQPTAGFAPFRNRVINGDMRIAQRGTTFTSPVDGTYTLDRWISGNANDGTVTVTQSTDAPTGFQNSLRVTVTAADTSLSANQYGGINGRLEGLNVADVVDDTFTLSFWVRSSKTGTHCVSIRTGGSTNSYVATYTINQANTWEYETIVVSGGLPTGVTTAKDNTTGLNIWFTTGCGSTFATATGNAWVSGNFISTTSQVNVHDTVGNIFAITGVQLEKGSAPTAFEYLPIGTQLAMCQRYYEIGTIHQLYSGYVQSGEIYYNSIRFAVTKRASPTIVAGAVNGVTLFVQRFPTTALTPSQQQPDGFYIQATANSTGTGYYQYSWTASAEI